jgi:hypothetical protein
VRVTPVEGGEQLAVERVPSWLFDSIVGDRGHEPWGKVDVPGDGRYRIEATADRRAPFGSEPLENAPPADDSGPEIAVGASPWSPFGSKLLGAVLGAIAVFALSVLLSRVLRRATSRFTSD